MTTDMVNHPPHYTSHPSGIECIEITEHMGFNVGNAVKYLWRADLKEGDPLVDLRKAAWYINREINRRQPAPDTEAEGSMMATHEYLSTACLHEAEARSAGDVDKAVELHAYCAGETGCAGAKEPAQCKFCQAPCTCLGHGVALGLTERLEVTRERAGGEVWSWSGFGPGFQLPPTLMMPPFGHEVRA